MFETYTHTHTVREHGSAVHWLSLGSTALEQTMQYSYLSLRITAAGMFRTAFSVLTCNKRH